MTKVSGGMPFSPLGVFAFWKEVDENTHVLLNDQGQELASCTFEEKYPPHRWCAVLASDKTKGVYFHNDLNKCKAAAQEALGMEE